MKRSQLKHIPMLGDRALGYRATQVLAFIRKQIESVGTAPSYAEICDALGIVDFGNLSRMIDTLERRGLVSRVGIGRVRRIRMAIAQQTGANSVQ